ncbi:ABC transporter ATP-binding protein [Flavobacterium selenitireducens]|uniref:ABC transporter ATP-binding protein n=1 Tax=Flavobacterium selenitireducens TaxID=2722704 RepID=UPI00168A52DE|nr:ABC transporter ATP-binding protein [Flavobacterium selenitireducens]MBD3582165.1 ABC transporter ATP-binding protein [Flavobacterium selenitireducens]
MDAIIDIHDIAKKYKGAEHFSVKPLSLQIYKGEVFGLLGPNGAGKTTLISMLCGLLEPTSGDFAIDGKTYEADEHELKKIIGVVPQEYALYPTLSAKENLNYFGSMYGLKGSEFKDKIAYNLERLGLTKFAKKRIDTYSGGMKRRINLIAGIMHEPKVLFLDEPTVGVDVHSKNVIMEYLTEINQRGTTIIYTSHHMTEAQDFCTRIAIIDRGVIYAQGTPSELISSTPDARNLEDVFLSLTGKALRDA